jgi:hypothetical protein
MFWFFGNATKALNDKWQAGYDHGEFDGEDAGYAAGYVKGQADGYAEGQDDGRLAGLKEGQTAGFLDGYRTSRQAFAAAKQETQVAEELRRRQAYRDEELRRRQAYRVEQRRALRARQAVECATATPTGWQCVGCRQGTTSIDRPGQCSCGSTDFVESSAETLRGEQ